MRGHRWPWYVRASIVALGIGDQPSSQWIGESRESSKGESWQLGYLYQG